MNIKGFIWRMAKNKVSENMTLDEAAEFWDKHSFLDYDDIKEVHFSVDLQKNECGPDMKQKQEN